MATCPSCGKEQVGASAFCAACGAVLDRPDTDAALPAPPVAPTQIIPPRVAPGAAAAAQSAEDFGDIGQYIARRLLALVVDLIGVTLLLATGVEYLLARQGQDPHSGATFFATAVYTLFGLIVYLCLGEAYLGTTLGKALFGLRVTSLDGGRVGIVRAVVRNVFLPFDLMAIGFVLAAFTRRHRRIGDYVAGTEVMNAHSGALGPVIAALVLAGWGYGEYALADGARMAQTLSNEAQTYGPGLIGGQPTPAPPPSPLPERTPVPTEQPITIPTIAPTPGNSPAASASPGRSPAVSPSQSPGAGASATPSAVPGTPSPTPPPPTTT